MQPHNITGVIQFWNIPTIGTRVTARRAEIPLIREMPEQTLAKTAFIENINLQPNSSTSINNYQVFVLMR